MNWSWDTRFRYIMLAALMVFVVWAVWYIREIYRPLIISAVLAYFLSPAVNFLVLRFRLRRKLAANLVYFTALVIFLALPFTVLPALSDEFQSIRSDFNHALDGLQLLLSQPRQLGSLNIYLGLIIPGLRGMFSGALVAQPQDALRLLQMTSRGFLWTLVVLVMTYYFLNEWTRMRLWLIRLAPEPEQVDLHRLYLQVRRIWMGYLGGQLRLIAILAILYMLAWLAIGLPGSVALGLLAGLLNLLPEIGPASAALLAVVVAFLEGSNFLPISNLWFALLTLGVYLLINNIKTIWIQPRVLGQSVLMHEGIVFVAIIAAVILQGVLGVLIVVPLLASLGVIGSYLRKRLMGLPPFPASVPEPAAQPQSDEPAEAASQRPAAKARSRRKRTRT